MIKLILRENNYLKNLFFDYNLFIRKMVTLKIFFSFTNFRLLFKEKKNYF